MLRAELRRLFRWLRDRDLTVVITGERGEGTLTRHGLEEYVSDAVIQLDHRVDDQISTRRIRVVKYRGSHHGTNEYPFLIDADGLSVLPVTSLQLQHDASLERVSSGLPQLDEMLGGKGYYRGSTVLVSGTAGTGKTSLAAQFADAACRRGERCLYFLFEESPQQMVRNMRVGGRGPAAVGRQRPTPVPRGSAFALRPGDPPASRCIAPSNASAPTWWSSIPMTNLLMVGTPDRRPRDAHAHDRLPEDPRRHGDVHRADVERRRDGRDRDDDLVADGHVDPADQRTGQRRRHRWLYVLKSRGMAHSDETRRVPDHGAGDLHPGPAGQRPGGARVMSDEIFDLRLYVAGQTPKAIRAFANLRTLCEEHLAGRYKLEVIDLLEDPQLGRGDQILGAAHPGAQAARRRSRRSSATSPTPSACSWAWTCVRARKGRVTERATRSITEPPGRRLGRQQHRALRAAVVRRPG